MADGNHKLVLASSSPRRRRLLESLGAEFVVRAASVNEQRVRGESPEAMVMRLAREKARAVATPAGGAERVLGADTTVVLGSRVFEKPRDESDGLGMLEALSGRVHRVLSGVALLHRGLVHEALSTTEVRFRTITRAEALRYWRTGEPAGKAGAYAIQGFGGLFVASIMGSYSGVVGLPVFETAGLLRATGYDLLPQGDEEDGENAQ